MGGWSTVHGNGETQVTWIRFKDRSYRHGGAGPFRCHLSLLLVLVPALPRCQLCPPLRPSDALSLSRSPSVPLSLPLSHSPLSSSTATSEPADLGSARVRVDGVASAGPQGHQGLAIPVTRQRRLERVRSHLPRTVVSISRSLRTAVPSQPL